MRAGSAGAHFGFLINARNKMTRISIAISLLLLTAPVLAQSGTPEEQKACSPDVKRYCRKVISEGDFSILACLQQNRATISKACRKVLADHGQ
jgi:Cysteine rich repeat